MYLLAWRPPTTTNTHAPCSSAAYTPPMSNTAPNKEIPYPLSDPSAVPSPSALECKSPTLSCKDGKAEVGQDADKSRRKEQARRAKLPKVELMCIAVTQDCRRIEKDRRMSVCRWDA